MKPTQYANNTIDISVFPSYGFKYRQGFPADQTVDVVRKKKHPSR